MAITTPWVPGPARGHQEQVQMMTSRFELRHFWQVPGFLLASMRILRQMSGAPGAVGATLRAAPLRRTFWTLSAWTGKEALYDFAKTEPHRGLMRRFAAASDFEFWTAERPADWPEALRRLSGR